MEPAGHGRMIPIAWNVVTDRCERCGRVLLLSMIRDGTGRTMLWCKRCISEAGVEGFVDPLQHARFSENN